MVRIGSVEVWDLGRGHLFCAWALLGSFRNGLRCHGILGSMVWVGNAGIEAVSPSQKITKSYQKSSPSSPTQAQIPISL